MRVIAKRAVTSSKEQSVEPNAAPVIDSAAAAAGGGTVLHLRADKGLTTDATGKVSIWADQSPNSNNFVQNISANQPTFTNDGNGTASILFTPNTNPSFLRCTPTNHYDKTVVYVYKSTFLSGRNAAMLGYSDVNTQLENGVANLQNYFYTYDTTFPAFMGQVVDNTPTATNGNFTPNFYGGYDGVLLNQQDIGASDGTRKYMLYRNGSVYVDYPVSTSIPNTPIGLFNVGGYYTSTRYYPYYMYEVIVFDRILTQTETDAMAAYVTANYGAL